MNLGKQVRLQRSFNRETGRAIIVPMDHGVSVGPIEGIENIHKTVSDMADGGADAVLMHKGLCRCCFRASGEGKDLGLIIHLSASTSLSSYSNKKRLVCTEKETIRSGAYAEAILRRRSEAQVRCLACPLFVPVAEEGWFDGPIVEGVVSRYLSPIFDKAPAPDCLVLGCTHYPMLAAAIRKVLGPDGHFVDSAATTAEVVRLRLADRGLTHPQEANGGNISYFITDDPQRFTRTGSLFLNMDIKDGDVRLVDLENVPLPDDADPTSTQRKTS